MDLDVVEEATRQLALPKQKVEKFVAPGAKKLYSKGALAI